MQSRTESKSISARAGALVASLVLAIACGGDAGSAPQTQAQPNPAPTITSVTPDQLLLGQPATLTVKGTGFIQGSSVSWRNLPHAATYVDASTLTVSLSPADVPTLGAASAVVVNLAPGGGSSSAAFVNVVSSIPVITSLSPTSGASGADLPAPGLQVTISGTGFVPESAPMWDTQRELSRSGMTATTITAILPPDLLSVGGNHQIWVKNKSTGGGRSNTLDFNVINAVPSITTLVPDPASTGAAFTMLVVGKGFMRNSIVRWNGADRPTTYDAGNLYAEIPASDVAAVGAATVTVFNPPPAGGTSAPTTLAIRQAPLAVVGTIDVENFALARDSTRNLLYASIPSGAGARQNTIVKIDPTTATIVGSLAVGLDPRRLAISDDDRYLYATLRTTPRIVRIDLATFTKDFEFDPGAAFGITNGIAEDLMVLPGAPKTVAAVVRNVGVVLFDDGVARIDGSATKGVGKGSNIVRGPDGSHVYGYNDLSTLAFYGNLVTPSGLTVESAKTGVLGTLASGVAYDAGRLYATSGAVIDPVALTVVGTYGFNFPTPSAVAADARHGRVHFLVAGGIYTYGTQSFTQLDAFPGPSLLGLYALTRWGEDGLAVGSGSKIVIMRGSIVAP